VYRSCEQACKRSVLPTTALMEHSADVCSVLVQVYPVLWPWPARLILQLSILMSTCFATVAASGALPAIIVGVLPIFAMVVTASNRQSVCGMDLRPCRGRCFWALRSSASMAWSVYAASLSIGLHLGLLRTTHFFSSPGVVVLAVVCLGFASYCSRAI